jgi:hypothetical protein
LHPGDGVAGRLSELGSTGVGAKDRP